MFRIPQRHNEAADLAGTPCRHGACRRPTACRGADHGAIRALPIRFWMLAAATSALCLSASAQGAALADNSRLPASSRPYAEHPMLLGNAENRVRTIVPADEQMGLLQLHALVARARLEEQWAYVPALGFWIEVGHSEAGTEADPQVQTDAAYLRTLVGLLRAVHLVHLHPASAYVQGDWEERLFPTQYPAGDLKASDLRLIGYALPSPDDVWSSIDLNQAIHREFPAAQVRHSVVSPHGIVSYGPTEQGLAKIISDGGNPRKFTARDIVTRAAIRRADFNIARTIQMLQNPTIGDVIASLCAQASNENYVMAFTPF